MSRRLAAAYPLVLLFAASALAAEATPPAVEPEPVAAEERATVRAARASGPIVLDGVLDEPTWREADEIGLWYQIVPLTDAPPQVASRGWLAFDDRALYVALELDDPDPAGIRAPMTDRDNWISSSDYAGIIIDGVNDGKTAQEFLANPHGVQYDGIWSDIVGESLAPNFHYQSAGRIHDKGWTLEMRIPFSSIRYARGAAPEWGVTLFRNRPRERRYEFATAKETQSACFICNENRLVGLEDLPSGGAWLFAPYVTARRSETPEGDVVGAPLGDPDDELDGGFDFKWNPSPRHTVDLTWQPDFSQVESDVPQIATNQRFALFFPERRPFFLEQVDLFSVPIDAVYTRTVTDPRGGARATGRFGKSAYTVLVSEDEGGGSVVIPGPTESRLADQAYESTVVLGRMRRDLGPNAFVSFVVTDREIEGGGHNRVFGPDFQWRRGETDSVTGQALWSDSRTPVLPDVDPEWDGRDLSDLAAHLSWEHGGEAWDWELVGESVGEEFRADNGFVPRVGYREARGALGRFFMLGDGFLRTLRLFGEGEYGVGEDDEILNRNGSLGVNLGGLRSFRLRAEARSEDLRVEDQLLNQTQGKLHLRVTPSGRIADLVFSAYGGSAIDFDNVREGDGWGVALETVVRSPTHFELRLDLAREVLDVDDPLLGSGRLFTADVFRARAVWTFTPRFWVRGIAQLERTERDPSLYTFAIDEKSEDVDASLLLAYKLDWQSVIYLGYGDSRTWLETTGHREPESREIFFKFSYAFRPR